MEQVLEYAEFVTLQNDCRVNAGLPPMTTEEEPVDYREYLQEEMTRLYVK